MRIIGVIRPLLAAGIVLGAAMPAAAECPAAATQPARPMPLHQMLALPNHPDPAIEGSSVATIGYLVRIHRVPAASQPSPAKGAQSAPAASQPSPAKGAQSAPAASQPASAKGAQSAPAASQPSSTKGAQSAPAAASAKGAACAAAGPVYRVWLATRVPYGLKGLAARHRAFVATLPAAAVHDRPGGLRALEKLVGRRIRVSGQMTFNAGGRDQMMRTRGSLWELRGLSEIAACPAASCPLTPPPAAATAPRH